MAGEVSYTRLLLGMGLRHFSMNSAQLLATKQRVLTTSLPEILPLTLKILRSDDPLKTQELLAKLNAG
jgi:phosphotransferase system enzyme I (PtsI)